MSRAFAAIVIVLSLPLHAGAAVEWAEWSGYPASTRTGTFPDGSTITMTPAGLDGSGSVPAGSGFDCTPAAPGMGNSDNPPYQQILSGGMEGVLVEAGDLVVEIDLSGLPDGAKPLFGIADQKFQYELVLTDDTDDLDHPEPQDSIDSVDYTIQYAPSPPYYPNGLIADQNSDLIDGTLYRDANNDAVPTDFYNQTGLTLLVDLPVETRHIRLLGVGTTEREGLSLFVGADFGATVEIADTSGSATDKSVSFGTITVGATTKAHIVTLTNPGDAAVEVTATPEGLEGGDFDVTDGCTGALAPAASCSVFVVFHPDAVGDVEGSIGIALDGSSFATVAVSGTGTLEKTGDANGDGATKAGDALLALRVSVGSETLTASILASCDMNGDAGITAGDALAILRKAVAT